MEAMTGIKCKHVWKYVKKEFPWSRDTMPNMRQMQEDKEKFIRLFLGITGFLK